MPPAQSPQLMQLLLLLVLVGLSWAQDVQMCENIRDDLGAASCAQVLELNAKGFRLTGTMNDPLRLPAWVSMTTLQAAKRLEL